MGHNRRTFLNGAAGMAATSMLAGCLGGGGGGSSANEVWHKFTEAEQDDLETHAETFRQQSEASIKFQKINNLKDKLTTSFPSNSGPGSFVWAHDWMGQLTTRGENGFLYDASEDVDISVYTEVAQQASTYDGGLYGLPYGAETVTLMYNKELVDSPPETFEEMVAVMDEFHDPENGKYGLSYPFDPYFVSAWVQAFGGFLYNDETDELGLEKDETVRGFEFLVDKIWPYTPKDPKYNPQTAVFGGGKAPFAINGPWQVGSFRDAGVDLGIAPLPTVEGTRPRPYTGIQMWYFSKELSGSDDALSAITEWAEWYTTNSDVLLSNAENQGLIPVHSEVSQSDQLDSDIKPFAKTFQSGVPMPQSPKMNNVWDPTGNALTQMINGRKDPRAALQKAAKTIQQRWDQ